MRECLGGSFEVEAFSGSVVEAVDAGAQGGVAEGIEVGFAGKEAPQSADGIFDTAFLPWASDIAEEGGDAERAVEAMMLGELGTVAHWEAPVRKPL